MMTGKFKVLIFAAILFTALNYSEVKAGTEVILVKSQHQNREVKISETTSDLNEAIKDMKYQLLCAQNEITKLQEINQNLTRSLSESEVKSQMIEKQKLSLEQNIADKDKQLGEIAAQANLKLIAGENEIAELKNQLALANKRADDITGEKIAQVNELKNQLSIYLKRTDDMSLQIASLNNELNMSKQEYLSANLKSESIISSKETQIIMLQNQSINTGKQIQDLSDKITLLNNELTKAREVNTLAIDKQKDLESLVVLANKKAFDISEEKAAQITELKNELTLQANQKFASENEIAELKNQLLIYRKKSEDMSLQIASLNNELNLSKQEYLSTNSKSESIASDKDFQINMLKSKSINSEKQIQDLSDKVTFLNNELIKAREVNTLAVDKQKDLEKLVILANKKAFDISEEKTAQINELKNELTKQAYQKPVTSENEIVELKNQLSIYRKKAEDMSLQVASLNNELSRAKQEYLSVNVKNNNAVSDKDFQITLLKNQLAFSEKQIQDLSDKITALNNTVEKTKEVYNLALLKQKELENLIILSNKRADNFSSEKPAQINELNKEFAMNKNTNVTSAVLTQPVIRDYQKTAAPISSVDNTKSAEDYFNIAKAYQDAKDYQEAINNFKHAITLNTSFGSAYKELGLIYLQMGDYNNAGNSLKKCLYHSNNPKEQEVLRNFISNIERYAGPK